MKYLLLIVAVLATQVQAQEITCNHKGVTSVITIKDNTLVDDMEKIIATETSTGQFETADSFGKVFYTIHGNTVIMHSLGITKEYHCEL